MPTGTISVNDGTVNVSDLEVKYQGTGTTSYNSATAPTNVGTYTVTYKVPDTNTNYTGTFSVAFTIKKAQLEKVTIVKDTFEYTGTDITPTLNNVNSNIEVTGDTKAKNVSNNTITAKIKDISNIHVPAPSHNVSKASSLCSIAIEKYNNNIDVYDCYSINPLYIRKSQAEVQYDEKMKRLNDGK